MSEYKDNTCDDHSEEHSGYANDKGGEETANSSVDNIKSYTGTSDEREELEREKEERDIIDEG